MTLVEYLNGIYWDGPLRGRLCLIARQKSATAVEIWIRVDDDEPVSLMAREFSPKHKIGDLQALQRDVITQAEKLLAAQAHSLFRHRKPGQRVELTVPTMGDVHEALGEALGDRPWSSALDAIAMLASDVGASRLERSRIGDHELCCYEDCDRDARWWVDTNQALCTYHAADAALADLSNDELLELVRSYQRKPEGAC